jgi:hypothetical protein
MQQRRQSVDERCIGLRMDRGKLFLGVPVNHRKPAFRHLRDGRYEPALGITSIEAQQVLLDAVEPFPLLSGPEPATEQKLHTLLQKLLILSGEERLHGFSDA